MRLNSIKDVLKEKGVLQMCLLKKLSKNFSTVNTCACNRLYTLSKICENFSFDMKNLITNEHVRKEERTSIYQNNEF